MNSYCSKSATQRARKCMREHRSRRRTAEVSEILRNEENENASMNYCVE